MRLLTVNFYKAEVKYSGDISDYTVNELFNMAMAKADKGVDIFDHSERYSYQYAKDLDGQIRIGNVYPDNHLVMVHWSFIDDADPEYETLV